MITRDRLNRNLLAAQYAVRGPIVTRAQQLEEQGRKIIYCNIGNPQALKQKPLTYLRQMLSLLEYPGLLEHPASVERLPKDIIRRVKRILSDHPYGTGAYTQSTGIPFVRQAVADFIHRRDGIATSRDRIILTDGASKGVQAVLLALLREKNDGFMIPVPQYPLYSASISLFGGKQVDYFLDEENSWQLGEQSLNKSIEKAKAGGIHPVAIVVINPGNPTGAVLTYQNIEMVVRFARKNSLAIIADEVYQENVYDPEAKFYSFAKVMNDMKETAVSLFSLHSVSKGFLGECGHRGGYLELRNIPDDVMAEFVKLQSISLCANVPGQLAVSMMVDPPRPGDESHELYEKEKGDVLRSLKHKAEILGEKINQIDGMSVEIPRGAMYAFVKFQLPSEKGIDIGRMTSEERTAYDTRRDSEYCLALLEQTGLCVVPGSGFGQPPGTLHFRTTFLPPKEEIEDFVVKLRQFHENYVRAESLVS